MSEETVIMRMEESSPEILTGGLSAGLSEVVFLPVFVFNNISGGSPVFKNSKKMKVWTQL